MSMKSANQSSNGQKARASVDDQRTRRLVLGGAALAAIGALAIMVLVIPRAPGTQSGVGANGYTAARVVNGADLGIDKVASTVIVRDALGPNAKFISPVKKSPVVDTNGNRGQTASYDFVTAKGVSARIDIDVLQYKSQAAYDNENPFRGAGLAARINGREVGYVVATTIGSEREYALLVAKGLKSYKFAIDQPADKITLSELVSQDVLKKIIEKSTL